MSQSVIAAFASSLIAFRNCVKSGNAEWQDRWQDRIDHLNEMLPSGSGFDSGSRLAQDECTGTKLVFNTQFHHMDDNGYYCGWSDHQVIVTPTFDGFDLRVTGRDKRDIKDYIAETFHTVLSQPAPALRSVAA